MDELGYICWLVGDERDALLDLIPPQFPNVVAHHVTFRHGVLSSCELPEPKIGFIVGEIIDGGVQAVVVEIDGDTIRPDGKRFHITWSLDEDRFPQQSIALTSRGWFPFEKPMPVSLTPQWIKITKEI
jgi:hypothetical protein